MVTETRLAALGESALAIAVTEGAFARDVGTQTLVQDRLRGVERGERVDNRGQQIVIDLDKVERVLGGVAAARDNDRHRLADIADAVNGNRPALDRRFHADDQAGGQGGDILTDEHSRHPGRLAGGLGADGGDPAWAWGERRIAACRVPGLTPRSSTNRPRPVSSAASSTRSTDWPHQIVGGTADIPLDIPRCALIGTCAETLS